MGGLIAVGIGCTSREADTGAKAGPGAIPPPPQPAQRTAEPVRERSAAEGVEIPDGSKEPGALGRVYALSRNVWVYPEPDVTRQWIGFLWLGGSVPIRNESSQAGPGCAHFYAIEPRGYVCVDDKRATTDSKNPVLVALRPYAPNVDSPWPHRYGESRGIARYEDLPTEQMQLQRESDLRDQLERIERAKEGGKVHFLLEGVDLAPAPSIDVELPPLPRGLREDRRRVTPQSAVAYSVETFKNGRSWLLSGDLWWMPKDRVALYPKVTYHGVHLGRDANLPLAFFRNADQPKYTRNGDSLVATSESFARLSWRELTGRSLQVEGTTYLEAKDGSWFKKDEAVVPELRERTPWGAPVGGTDETTTAPAGRQTWLDVSVWGGWLIAYEGTRPVFTTLVSSGRGGTPQQGRDPLETAATPTGRFKITGKFKTATMVAPGELIHSDVPWAQNFTGPYALHGAYWHNDWGKLKSGGCINVSPIDGKWLFEWTEPRSPEGWHGVRWLPRQEPSTTLLVRR